MKNIFFILILTLGKLSFAQSTLDTLLDKVKNEQKAQEALALQRESEFLSEKDKQQEILRKAKAELSALEAKTQSMTKVFESNENELTVLEDKLKEITGTLGEMFGVVKQMSTDLGTQMENSIVSAQLKGRHQFILDLGARKELPNIEELKKLWLEILNEINESGKIVTFKSTVIENNGEAKNKDVTRVGTFNLISEGKYLSYSPETLQIVEIGRQPDSKYLSLIEDFQEEKSGLLPLGIDPSRGTLLAMLVNAPDFMERFHQGGIVGYAIVFIMFIGVVIVIERFIRLGKEKKLIDLQLQSNEPNENNSLGRLFKIFNQYKDKDIETLELKMDESILKSIPPLESGIGTLKIFVAIGPLMGLLGTVTGMIDTFQSITLFGTGDPKLMAEGISTALVTTVQGLVCSIPILLLHNYISNKSKDIIQILEEQSAGLLAKKASK